MRAVSLLIAYALADRYPLVSPTLSPGALTCEPVLGVRWCRHRKFAIPHTHIRSLCQRKMMSLRS
jgi:hypothetical protein